MALLRWALLSLGVILVAVALVGAAVVFKDQQAAQASSAAMPVGTAAPEPGEFREIKRTDFRIRQLSTYEFSPSEATRQLASKHAAWRGPNRRVWYEVSPKRIGPSTPLVILLHGAGRDGLSLIEIWKDVAAREGIALLALDSIGSSWRLEDADPAFLVSLVDKMVAHHGIDPARIYLFGHSSGAFYAQYLLNRVDGPWAAAALHAGYAPSNALQRPATPKPYRLYLGAEGHIFSVETARALGRGLAEVGHDNELVIIPRHTHWLYQVGPQIAADAWDWLDSRPR
ncbi:PHB depolymerase family esterase [Roseovarius sp. S1116L3]|uniref:PHB depolymerase family esterase n=1 Tax=Roseovarius roseus TaxID=3342636 RepID=UPI00372B4BC0